MPAFGLAYLFGEDQLFTIYKKRELTCDLIQFFCVATETLLVRKTYLFHKVFIVVLQLIKTILHLEDDFVLCLMIHRIQFIWCEFSAHTDRLSL